MLIIIIILINNNNKIIIIIIVIIIIKLITITIFIQAHLFSKMNLLLSSKDLLT